MEDLVDEADHNGPSLHDRIARNWTTDAKRSYRWTSTAMPVDTGTSTQLMAISAAVIADGVPMLAKGDFVDVYVVSGIDYSRGRAPVVVRRVCRARDEGCLDGLRRIQDGKVAGVEVRDGYSVAGDRRFAKQSENLGWVSQKVSFRGEVTAVLR